MKLSLPSKIDKKKAYQLLSFGSIALLLITTLSIRVVGSGQKQQQITLKQQLSDITVQAEGKQKLSSFLKKNQETLNVINQTFPNEVTIIDFIDAVDVLISTTSTDGALSFSALVPSLANNQLQIPFIIRLEATTFQLAEFLRRFEKLPLLTQIGTISLKTPAGITSTSEITIGGRVYVQDPFSD